MMYLNCYKGVTFWLLVIFGPPSCENPLKLDAHHITQDSSESKLLLLEASVTMITWQGKYNTLYLWFLQSIIESKREGIVIWEHGRYLNF